MSAWSSTSGLVAAITVVRPARASHGAARDPRLGVCVDGARRLDEDEHLWVGEERAGQDEPLALSARERPAALVDIGVEALGKRFEDVLRVRDGDRLEDLVVVRPAPRIELRAQGSGEQDRRIRLADDDPAADVAEAEVLEGVSPSSTPSPLPNRPGRSAIAVDSCGPGRDDAGDKRAPPRGPRRRSSLRGTPDGGSSAGDSGSATCGSTVSTSSMRRAPTGRA